MWISAFDRNRRNSLTFDLIEEFRQQLVDKVILSLINTAQLMKTWKREMVDYLEKRKLGIAKVLDKVNSKISFDFSLILIICPYFAI